MTFIVCLNLTKRPFLILSVTHSIQKHICAVETLFLNISIITVIILLQSIIIEKIDIDMQYCCVMMTSVSNIEK